MNQGRLTAQLSIRLVLMILFVGALLFVPAGTWRYWEAWVYCIVFAVPSLLISFYLVIHDPELVERRMNWREKEKQQQVSQSVMGLFYLAGFVVAGFDHRHNWSEIPIGLVLFSDAMVLVSYLLIFIVFLENPYAASTVVVEQDQPVISSGLYGIVRHPMYMGALLMFLFTPLALGSYWALIPFVLMYIGLVLRIQTEEKVLSRELPGYNEYRQKVRWRLIPGVW